MSGKTDVVKGRIKEAAGALTNNNDLRKEGKADQVAGRTKETVRKAVNDIKAAAHQSINKLKDD